jgi:hypothetical protein
MIPIEYIRYAVFFAGLGLLLGCIFALVYVWIKAFSDALPWR